MRIQFGVRALGLALSLALLTVGAPGVSFAQGLPGGSYANSCSNIQMVANVLEASCQTSQGAWVSAALPNPGSCAYGVVNSNGALVCASAPAVSTSQTTDGLTTLTNPCPNNQKALYGIATNNSATKGLVVIVQPGQSVQIGVTKGSSYESGCGTLPSDTNHFQYFNLTPLS